MFFDYDSVGRRGFSLEPIRTTTTTLHCSCHRHLGFRIMLSFFCYHISCYQWYCGSLVAVGAVIVAVATQEGIPNLRHTAVVEGGGGNRLSMAVMVCGGHCLLRYCRSDAGLLLRCRRLQHLFLACNPSRRNHHHARRHHHHHQCE